MEALTQDELRRKHKLPVNTRNIAETTGWRTGQRIKLITYEMGITVLFGRVEALSWADYSLEY